MRFYFAPMEGITDHVFRGIHCRYFPGVDKYFTPFFSPTGDGRFTGRSVRDLDPAVNVGLPVVPQLLAKRSEDFLWAARELAERGYREVNLNLGCPSGTVVAKGKGSGMLSDPEGLDRFLSEIFASAPTAISIKTRLGRKQPEEFPRLLEIFNQYPIAELTVHCRVRDDLYRLPARQSAFVLPLEQSRNPVCYNGDLLALSHVQAFQTQFPAAQAAMLGRGAVADPSLIRQLQGGERVDRETLRAYTEELFEGYAADFGSRRNALGRMKEIWFYQFSLFQGAEKVEKQLRKTNDPVEYQDLVRRIFDQLELRQKGAQPGW